MSLPIRVRLTAWYAALLAIIIIGLGSFIVLQLRTDLRQDHDRELDAATDHMAAAFEDEGREDFRDIAQTLLPRTGSAAALP